MASSLQRTAGPFRGSTTRRGSRLSLRHRRSSTVSSFSSCRLLERARVAVLARALFLAMNSSRCRRFASTVAFVRSSRSRRSLLVFEKGVDLAGIHRQLAARQVERVRAGGARETTGRARRSGRPLCSSAESAPAESACAGRGSSSVRRAGAGSARAASSAASLTRVCQPPESFETGPSR